jgi:DNA mismatch repair protein MutS
MTAAGQAPATYNDYRKVYQKYRDLYKQQVAVFYQVGSFFELYDVVNKTTGESWCNVKEVIDILGIQLSIKSEPDDPIELLFAGFPEYTLHRWAARLTQSGWTVVVVEQKKKDAKGRVEGREVTRVLSAGTHHEHAPATEAPYVASIWLEQQPQGTPKYAITALDLTTGFSTSYEGETRGKHSVWSADEGIHFFQIYNPREVIFHWRGDSFSLPSEGTIRRIFGIQKQPIHFRHAIPAEQAHLEVPLAREEFLGKHYQIQSLLPVREYLQIRQKELTERSLCCLFRFIEDHFSLTSKLQQHMPWNPTTTLLCGNNALAQLNFVSDNSNESILGIFNKCTTLMGKRAIRRRLLSPLTKKADIEQRLQRVDSMFHIDQSQIEQILQLMFDLPRLHRKIMNFTVSGGDVLSLYQTYKQIQALTSKVDTELFASVLPKKTDIETVLNSWEVIFSVSKAEKASENISFIRPGVSDEIDRCEQQIQALYSEVQKWIDVFGYNELRIEEKERTPITIRAPKQVIQNLSKKPVPIGENYKGTEFKQTKTVGHSIEAPWLERVNEKILGLRSKLASIVEQVLPRICIDFYNTTGAVWSTLETFVEEVDCSLCFAKVAEARGFYKPEILDNIHGSSISVENLRHPLIEGIASRTKYVTHDVTLDNESYGWLLYGMNASGKSSLMKAIGIAVLLAQCGSYVPAKNMRLAPFERLLTRILNVDNLWAGLSSFAVEVSELRDIFLRADIHTLVLGDELCSGTESVSATALVAAGISHLIKRQSRFVFATHYHDLFKLPEIRSFEGNGLSIWHLKVRYDPQEDILVYERTLSPGPGSTIYGIEVAKALGMPLDVLDSAIKFRKVLQGEESKSSNSSGSSSWNKNITVRVCEICGSKLIRDLEVHHIRPQCEANGDKHFEDGLARDDSRNLAVVCASCHDAHHAGSISISPIEDTSKGPRRIPTPQMISKKIKEEKWSPEQLQIIQKTVSEFSSLSPKMLRFKLLQEFEIIISEASIRKFKPAEEL